MLGLTVFFNAKQNEEGASTKQVMFSPVSVCVLVCQQVYAQMDDI